MDIQQCAMSGVAIQVVTPLIAHCCMSTTFLLYGQYIAH